jgi:hypothetical protein
MKEIFIIGGWSDDPYNPKKLHQITPVSCGMYEDLSEVVDSTIEHDHVNFYTTRVATGRYFGFRLSWLAIDTETNEPSVYFIKEQYKPAIEKKTINKTPQKAKAFKKATLNAQIFSSEVFAATLGNMQAQQGNTTSISFPPPGEIFFYGGEANIESEPQF